jgi:nucleoside phosphorylase
VPKPCDLVVVAAFPPELAGLVARLGRRKVGPRTPAVPVGVGLVAAAIGTVRVLQELRPRALVLVGTCGAYPAAGLHRDDAIVARRVMLVDPGVVQAKAAFPRPMGLEIDANVALTTALASCGAAKADVATTLAVTTDDALAAKTGRRMAVGVEHLEAYAVAYACAEFDVPFAAVLGVANTVGARGRTEWRKGHRAASDVAGRIVAEWIRAGARGVPR